MFLNQAMHKPSLQKIILAYLELKKEWVPEYALRSTQTPFGWIGSSGDVRCREMARKGLIQRKVEGKYAYLKHKEGTGIIEELRSLKEDSRPEHIKDVLDKRQTRLI